MTFRSWVPSSAHYVYVLCGLCSNIYMETLALNEYISQSIFNDI